MTDCLVLGGNGLIGSFIADILLEKGHRARAFDRFSGKQNLGEGKGSLEKVKGDFLKKKDVEKALQGMETVFHCIHTTVPRETIGKPGLDAETNILPSINLLEAASRAGVKKMVYLSSIAVYGEPSFSPISEATELKPISPYGVSKVAIEEYVKYFSRASGMDYAIVRPSACYGERQKVERQSGVVANFVYNALHGKPVEVYGKGEAVRDLTHAEDMARGIVAAAFTDTRPKVFNLGTGKGVSLNALAEKVREVVGKEVEIRHVKGRAGAKAHVYDITKAKEELHWKPEISLEAGLKRCVEEWGKE